MMFSRRVFLLVLASLFLARCNAKKYNIVFLIADDLRNSIGALGDKVAITPNINNLYKSGVSFTNMQVNKGECAPSRLALMTGMHIDQLRVWDFEPNFRLKNPSLKTFPQVLRSHGYRTYSLGKVFDPNSFESDEKEDLCVSSTRECSWDVRINVDMMRRDSRSYCRVRKTPWYPGSTRTAAKRLMIHRFKDSLLPSSQDTCVTTLGINMFQESADRYLKSLKEKDEAKEEPFFISIGYITPHMPWLAPDSIWDMYKDIPDDQFWADEKDIRSDIFFRTQSSVLTQTRNHELEQYREKPSDIMKRRAYYASVTYMDQEIGRMVDYINNSTAEVRDNTIILLWSDNGFHLGDHNIWAKKSNLETSLNVPFVLVPPKHFLAQRANRKVKSGSKYNTPVQEIDVFPTLLDMSELQDTYTEEKRSGVSLLPIIRNQKSYVRSVAVSQYWAHNTVKKRLYMGYSFKTVNHRYIVYMDFKKFSSLEYLPYELKTKLEQYIELYDYREDGSYERINQIQNKRYSKVASLFASVLDRNQDRHWSQTIDQKPFDQ